MPFLQVMSNRASEAFSFDRIQELKVRVQPNTDLGNLLGRLGIVQTAQERAALRAFPKSIKDSLLAVIRRALEPPAGERLQITVSWAPAYEYGVHIWKPEVSVAARRRSRSILKDPIRKLQPKSDLTRSRLRGDAGSQIFHDQRRCPDRLRRAWIRTTAGLRARLVESPGSFVGA